LDVLEAGRDAIGLWRIGSAKPLRDLARASSDRRWDSAPDLLPVGGVMPWRSFALGSTREAGV
jgi:hypothetical protein